MLATLGAGRPNDLCVVGAEATQIATKPGVVLASFHRAHHVASVMLPPRARCSDRHFPTGHCLWTSYKKTLRLKLRRDKRHSNQLATH